MRQEEAERRGPAENRVSGENKIEELFYLHISTQSFE